MNGFIEEIFLKSANLVIARCCCVEEVSFYGREMSHVIVS